MAKRVYVIHGWGDSPASNWIPCLKEELERKGFSVTAPDMPDTNNPSIYVWPNFISSLVVDPDRSTFLIGHSMGCQAIVRYLSNLKENAVIGGSVFVAPVNRQITNLSDEEKIIAKPWLETPINWNDASKHIMKSVVIYSDNDVFIPVREAQDFAKNIQAKSIMEEGKGHFSDANDVTQLPVALREILSIAES